MTEASPVGLRLRYLRGALWSLAGALASQGGSLAASVIAARLVGLEQFGQLGIIQSTITTLGAVAGLGLGVTATKHVAEFRHKDKARTGRILGLSSILAVITGALLAAMLFAGASLLAAALSAPEIGSQIRVASLMLVANAALGAQIGGLAGFESFNVIARLNTIRGALAVPLTTVLAWNWGLSGAVWALAVTALMTSLIAEFALRRVCFAEGIRQTIRGAWPERTILMAFTAPAFMSSSLVPGATWVAQALLVNQTAGYGQMGILNVATQVRTVITFVPTLLSQLSLPILANMRGNGEPREYRKAMLWNLLISGGLAASAACPVILFPAHVLRLFGGEIRGETLVIITAALIAILTSVNGVVGTAILSSGAVWTGFAFNLAWAVLFLAASILLVQEYMALGIVLAMLFAYLCHSIWQSVYALKNLSQPDAALRPVEGT
ncbi:MAG: oligosaccharide flippase family protein [Bryobacteraceae bacterium]|nr:oligosaccharide flippase family protein [Bryobacteraceae bacterium]